MACVLLFCLECDDFVKESGEYLLFCPKSLFFMKPFSFEELVKGGELQEFTGLGGVVVEWRCSQKRAQEMT